MIILPDPWNDRPYNEKKLTAPTPRFWAQAIELSYRILNNFPPLKCFGTGMLYFNIVSNCRAGGGTAH